MALHDIDANKPSGSMKIRVKTYCHTLKRYTEELEDKAVRATELEKRVREKREELLERRRHAMELLARRDRALRAELNEMNAAFERYLDEDEKVLGMKPSTDVPERDGDLALSSLRDDIAPLPPVVEVLDLSRGKVALKADLEAEA